MTTFLLPPGFRATDDDDNPLAGGEYRFYDGGTTTPKAVYSDADLSTSLGSIVALNASGEPVTGANVQTMIYMGTGTYKVRLYDADDVLIWEQDGIPGAVEEEEESTTALPETPVSSLTTSGTHTVADKGTRFDCNPTGGSFARTLPSAVTAGNGFRIGFRHNGTAGQVSIIAPGSQNIRANKISRSYPLVSLGETVWFVSDGSDWGLDTYAPPDYKATAPYFRILDRVSTPPVNPDPGARYIINDTPLGAWSALSFAVHDIAEADGNGSWIRYVPEAGWQAFDVDVEESLIFKNSQWESFEQDPGTSTLKTFLVQDQKSSGTSGGSPVATTWTTAVLNTSVVNTITNSSLASNTITLPAGRYRVHAKKAFFFTDVSRIRFKTADDDSIIIFGVQVTSGTDPDGNNDAATGAIASLIGEFEIADTTDFILQYWVADPNPNAALGQAASISSTVEVYATVLIEDLASLQGPKGDEGDPGTDGIDAGYQYQWSTATSGDPGTGKIRTNNATPASVTQIAVHQVDRATSTLTNSIASWDDSTSNDKATIRIHKETAPSNFLEFTITGAGTDQGDYWTFPVEYVNHAGTISNANDVAVQIVRIGDIGDPGTTVPDPSGLSVLSLTDYDRAADTFLVYDGSIGSLKKMALPVTGVDITHPTIGAVGDGVTNCDAAFAAAALLGGRIIIPDGDFLITDPVMTDLDGTTWDFQGGRVVQSGTAVPGFIVNADRVRFAGVPHIDCTSTKPTDNNANPYRAGIHYHAAILQIDGHDLTIESLEGDNWISGLGYHGTQANDTDLARNLNASNFKLTRFDFGILLRQFDGANLTNIKGRETENNISGDPPHLIYVTDRSAGQSKSLIIDGVEDTDNAFSSSVKVRNVKGVVIGGAVCRETVRGIEVGFCEDVEIGDYSITDMADPTAASDTQAAGITIDDCLNWNIRPGTIDKGARGTWGIRARSDLGTFGNQYGVIDSPTIEYSHDGSSTFHAIFIDDQLDVTINRPRLINSGTACPIHPIRINDTSTRTRIIDPETVIASGATNPERCVEVRSAAVDTTVIFDPLRITSYTSGSLSDSGTNTVKYERVVESLVAGSWTPGFSFATEGDSVITVNSASGFYRRHGKMLFVSFAIDFSTNAYTTAAGAAQVTGFPVAPTASQAAWGIALHRHDKVDVGSSTRDLTGNIASGATLMTLRQNNDAAASSNVTATGIVASTSNFIIQGSGWYEVA